jgi:hypothetical protein
MEACYNQAGLEVKDITIGTAVKISGSCANADGRQAFAKAIKAEGLGDPVSNHGAETQGRWPFTMTIETKTGRRRP